MEQVKFDSSSKVFKFGGGERKTSKGQVKLPCELAGKKVSVQTDIVDSDIPLLLSKTAMKGAKIKLDLENDKAEILGNTIDLDCTSSGHYCVPLVKEIVHIDECFITKEHAEKIYAEKETILKKLHKQFAHPTQERLKALMIDANVWDTDYQNIASKLYENCDIVTCSPHWAQLQIFRS